MADSSMALICLTCGDTGFKELLLRCSKCQITAEHHYCAAEISISNEEEFTYTCEKCLLGSAKKLIRTITDQPVALVEDLKGNSLLAKAKTNVQTSISDPVVTHDAPHPVHPSDHCDVNSKDGKKLKRKLSRLINDNNERPVALVGDLKENSAPILVETSMSDPVEADVVPVATVDPVGADVETHDAPHPSDDCDLQEDSLLAEVETTAQISLSDLVEADIVPPAQLVPVEADADIRDPSLSLPPSDDFDVNSKDGDELKRKRRKLIWRKLVDGRSEQLNDNCEGFHVDPLGAGVGTHDALPPLHTSDDCDVNSRDGQELKRKRRKLMDDKCDQPNVEDKGLQVVPDATGTSLEIPPSCPSKGTPEYVYAQPVIDPVWRGCFINPEENLDGLMAHLSCKACSKVIEAVKLMPPVLSVEMTQRTEIWPESFKLSPPSDEHIAIYFFPENEKSGVKAFDEVVNHIINVDLAFKVLYENIELRIFTSNKLPPPYWRFMGKYYLWGVFRNRKIEKSESVESMQMSPNSCGSNSPCSPLPLEKRMVSSQVV
ncbi:hypothetical protein ACHQM5_022253 [Ranunculus cassubicifolius]